MNKIVAIVPAAGSGKRFSDDVPKQFLKISEKSILELSIRPLLDFSDCLGVCVVVPPNDQYHKSLDVIQNPKVFVVEGGSSRMKSVMNGIKFWEESDTSYDYILIHDAVRPCLRSSDVQEIINSLEEEIDGIVLGIPCSDSIKEVSGENSLISNTLDRTRLWRAFTPQIFKRNILIKAAFKKNLKQDFTDEASLVEANQGRLKMVQGSKDNIKLTFPEDIVLIKSILISQGRMEN